MSAQIVEGAKPQTLLNENQAPHVALEDVETFLAMADAGLIPAQMNNCGAMQDNISLRHDTRVSLTM